VVGGPAEAAAELAAVQYCLAEQAEQAGECTAAPAAGVALLSRCGRRSDDSSSAQDYKLPDILVFVAEVSLCRSIPGLHRGQVADSRYYVGPTCSDDTQQSIARG
jgi:hypothetical protein